MRRFFTILIAGILMTGLMAPQAMSYSQQKTKFARFQMYDGRHGWSDQDVQRTIRWATNRWNVSFTLALAIAKRESGLNERAYNSASCASGIYQHLCNYWPGRVASFNRAHPRLHLGTSPFNPRSNVLVSIAMMAKPGGMDHWRATAY